MQITLTIDEALRSLRNARDDATRWPWQSTHLGIAGFVHVLDEDPLRSQLDSMLPSFDLDKWLAERTADRRGMGPARLSWPPDLGETTACRLAICRLVSESETALLQVIAMFFGHADNIPTLQSQFFRVVVDPLVRDIERLATLRVPSPVLDKVLALVPPTTGDVTLDRLLEEARTKFRDPNAKIRREALQILWDAWERLKSIKDPTDKKKSASELLDSVATDAPFREELEKEAKALTHIGNTFHIRHFEKDRAPLVRQAHVDYLFHRLFALIWLLLHPASN